MFKPGVAEEIAKLLEEVEVSEDKDKALLREQQQLVYLVPLRLTR